MKTGARQEPFFFIVGSGRSGTTLLQSLLSAHPRLSVPPETHYLKRAMDWGAATLAAPADFEAFWADLVAWSRFQDMGIPADVVRARIDRSGDHTFKGVFAAMLQSHADMHGAARAGEKTPSHYRHISRLLDWFPDARILFMRRDPRAVVASHLAAPWVTGQLAPSSAFASFSRRIRKAHVAERAALWRDANGSYLEAAAEDPRVKILAYEDLVHAPDDTMSAVCAFLGEEWSSDFASRTANDVPPEGASLRDFSDWRQAHRAKARAPVTGASVDKWKRTLSENEVAMIEAVCARPMASAGYEPLCSAAAHRQERATARVMLGALGLEDRLRRARVRY